MSYFIANLVVMGKSELTLLCYHLTISLLNNHLIISKLSKILVNFFLKNQISSRTLHIPWDEAGCLCPIGDLFNYDAPGEELSGIENIIASSNVDEEQIDFHSQRLTDGGFEEDSNAYCFYARTNYKKGDQVEYTVLENFKFFNITIKFTYLI
jgi:hypothetical protein